MGAEVTVIKNDSAGREVWRYQGVILERGPSHVTLEARFNRDDMELGYITFRRGDRFVEHYYDDRWYNIFELYDVTDNQLKGWYCNFTRPARIGQGEIMSDDLALDLFVYPDGRTLVLDEEEFAALSIDDVEREAVLAALDTLREMVRAGKPPFARG